MNFRISVVGFATIFLAMIDSTKPTLAASGPEIDTAVGAILSLCVGSGEKWEMTGGGSAGAALSLKRLNASGHIDGNVRITKSEARGLVAGIDSKLNAFSAQQADHVRECIAPYRKRIMDLILPPEPHPIAAPQKATQQPPQRAVSPRNIDGNNNEVHDNAGFSAAPTVRGDGNKYYNNFGTQGSQPTDPHAKTIDGDRNSVSNGNTDGQRPIIQGNDNSISHYAIIGGDPGKPIFMGSGAKVDGFVYAMAPKFFSPTEINRQFAVMIPLIDEFYKDRTDQLNPDVAGEATYLNVKLAELHESFRVRVVGEGKALQTISR